ncbi:MAG: hypothetical protein PHU51_00605 [Candidatus Nanoarchaeia archaeon]|nr:hypothetical protein [Candidatus Nanoarchaeia archaeon]
MTDEPRPFALPYINFDILLDENGVHPSFSELPNLPFEAEDLEGIIGADGELMQNQTDLKLHLKGAIDLQIPIQKYLSVQALYLPNSRHITIREIPTPHKKHKDRINTAKDIYNKVSALDKKTYSKS